jgi:hypothetical protein
MTIKAKILKMNNTVASMLLAERNLLRQGSNKLIEHRI